MYKQHYLNTIEKEINICSRLCTKIPSGQMNFRPKEGVRSILELLQYLGIVGSTMPAYWLNKEDTDFETFFSCIKCLSGYKLQLFLFSKFCDNQKLATPDAWLLTDLSL